MRFHFCLQFICEYSIDFFFCLCVCVVSNSIINVYFFVLDMICTRSYTNINMFETKKEATTTTTEKGESIADQFNRFWYLLI
jgi:hypothetical protein